jgi:hypothetical protein
MILFSSCSRSRQSLNYLHRLLACQLAATRALLHSQNSSCSFESLLMPQGLTSLLLHLSYQKLSERCSYQHTCPNAACSYLTFFTALRICIYTTVKTDLSISITNISINYSFLSISLKTLYPTTTNFNLPTLCPAIVEDTNSVTDAAAT